MNPHTAVSYMGLRNFRKQNPDQYVGVFLETAIPENLEL